MLFANIIAIWLLEKTKKFPVVIRNSRSEENKPYLAESTFTGVLNKTLNE